jgi:hypothetical protein
MMQVTGTTEAGQVTSSGTSVTTFSSVPGRLFVIQAASTNAGTVTITKPSGTGGIVLSAGDPPLTLWGKNLNQFAYITSTSGDKINYLATY